MGTNYLLEVCVASVEDALAAQAGGAERLELNVALELGGLTPTVALFDEVKQAVASPIIVMVRPCAAGFCYSSLEKRLMLRDADSLLDRGASGIAAGCLLEDRSLDHAFWRDLVRLAGDRDAVFHRAFDVVDDPTATLEQLVGMGTKRVLTSGGAATVLAGKQQIAHLQTSAADRIEVLPGAGIDANNVAELLRSTGCNQVHGSFSDFHSDDAGCVANAEYPKTSRERVAATRQVLDRL